MPTISGIAGTFKRGVGGGGFSVAIDVPTRLGEVAKRHHNRMAKAALTKVLETHHRKRVPLHFKSGAHQKYNYAPRSEKYIRAKGRKWGNTMDLVKTGASRDNMIANGKIVMSGSAEGGKKGLSGRLVVQFAFPGGASGRYRAGANAGKVANLEQMKKEIQAMTDDERQEIAKEFLTEFMAQIAAFKGSRQRVRNPTT